MDIKMQIAVWAATLADPSKSEDEKREVMKLAIQHLRADRKMHIVVGAIKKEKKVPKSAQTLLDDFANQMETKG